MAEPTVSAGFAEGLLEFAVSRGALRPALLEQSGLNACDLADGDARVPFAGYVALMRAAKALSGDPALALHFGEAIDISEMSIVGLIGHASETMAEAFVQLNRYVKLIVQIDGVAEPRFQLVPVNGGIWMEDRRESPNDFPELTESAFAHLVCGPRRFDPSPFVKAVHVTHEDPGYREEYERIFQAPVLFGAEWNAIQFDESWPGHRVSRLPRYVFGVLSEKADALLQDLERAETLRARVEGLLLPKLHTGAPNVEAVASRLGLSRQTLFRRLRAEGTTFEKVLDDLRRRLALDYISGRKASVNETAYLVGYSDPAAFSRAFKRWTGMNPRDALQQHAK